MNPLLLAGGVAAVLTYVEAYGVTASPNPYVGTTGTATGAVTGAGGQTVGSSPSWCPLDDNGVAQWWCNTDPNVSNGAAAQAADAAKRAASWFADGARNLIGDLIPDWVWVGLAVGGFVYLVHSGVI